MRDRGGATDGSPDPIGSPDTSGPADRWGGSLRAHDAQGSGRPTAYTGRGSSPSRLGARNSASDGRARTGDGSDPHGTDTSHGPHGSRAPGGPADLSDAPHRSVPGADVRKGSSPYPDASSSVAKARALPCRTRSASTMGRRVRVFENSGIAMRCGQCDIFPATLHVTFQAGNVVTEQRLCQACGIKMLGFSSPSRISRVRRCETCGLSVGEIRARGRVGCANDYVLFEKELAEALEGWHGTSTHVGKVPRAHEECVTLLGNR